MKSVDDNTFQRIIEDDYFLGLNRLNRWVGNDTIRTETVGGHSYDVTIIIRVLVEEIFPIDAYKEKLEIVTDAAFHDFDEVFSGDINHKVKYNPINGNDIKKAIQAYCDGSLKTYFGGSKSSSKLLLKSTTDTTQHSKDLIKVADWLSMSVFCKKEIEMGNSKFKKTLHHCVTSLNLACIKSMLSLKALNHMETNLAELDNIINLKWE